MAYSEIKRARYNYPNGDYFEFKGILSDLWGGGTLSSNQRIDPENSYNSDSVYDVYRYDNPGFWKIVNVENFRGDEPGDGSDGLLITSYYDSKSGKLVEDIDPPGQFDFDHGLYLGDMEGRAFYKNKAYNFNTEKSIDFPGTAVKANSNIGSAGNENEDNESVSSEFVIMSGNAKNNKLRGRKQAAHLKGMDGNDKIIGSNKGDILDGGNGDDVLNGKKGADLYVLSSGNDIFKGFKIKEGDTVHIDSGIQHVLVQSKRNTLIYSDDAVTTIFNVNKDDLERVVEIV